MADFASVFQLANRPTVALETPQETAMKSASLASAMMQQQHMGLQNEQLQIQIEQAKKVQQALAGVSNPQDAIKKLNGIGSPYAIEMASKIADSAHKGFTVQKEQADMIKGQIADTSRQILGLANAPGITPDHIKAFVAGSNIPDEAKNNMLSTLPADASGLPAWGNLVATQGNVSHDFIKMFTPTTEVHGATAVSKGAPALGGQVTGVNNLAIPQTTGAKTLLEEKQGLLPKGQAAGVLQKERSVPYGQVTLGGGGGAYGGGAGIGGGVSAAKSDAQILADKLRKGEAQWPTSMTVRTDPIMREALNIARRDEPGFDEGTYKQRQNAIKDLDTGKLGTSKNAIMTIFGHLGHLADAYGQLPDYGMRGVNWAAQTLKEYGPGGNPILQEVKDIQEAIGPEMSRVYMPTGQGSVTERTGWKERINPARPDAERKANLGAFGELLVTKLNQNYEQAKQSMKGIPEDQWPRRIELSQDAYEALKKIESYTGKPIKGADRWIKDYEKTNGIESTAKPTSPMLPYQGKSATMDQIKASGASKGWDEATAKRKWIEGGGKVVQ